MFSDLFHDSSFNPGDQHMGSLEDIYGDFGEPDVFDGNYTPNPYAEPNHNQQLPSDMEAVPSAGSKRHERSPTKDEPNPKRSLKSLTPTQCLLDDFGKFYGRFLESTKAEHWEREEGKR